MYCSFLSVSLLMGVATLLATIASIPTDEPPSHLVMLLMLCISCIVGAYWEGYRIGYENGYGRLVRVA